ALGQLLALLDLRLRLLDAGREPHGCEDGLLRVVQVGHTLQRSEVDEAQRVADRHSRDVQVDVLGDLHRQRFDIDLTLHLRETAALLRTDRLADQLDGDARLDRLVEPHLLQVDMRDVPADRVLLIVLEDRRVRRRLALQDDVEDRVQAALASQNTTELALGDADRVRLLAVAVEDAGNEALTAQAARVSRAASLALLDLQLDSFSGHSGAEW